MNDRELDRLAALIADALLRARRPSAPPAAPPGPWLRPPVRPEPVTRGGEPPVWSGAGQRLDDVAPGRGSARGSPPAEGAIRRQSVADMTNAARAAAAGRGTAPVVAPTGRAVHRSSGRSDRRVAIEVGIGVSNRHVHLSPEHVRTLFGTTQLSEAKPLTQPGQFAAQETVAVAGPKGRIESVRVVGPSRGETQLELSLGDARTLGITPVVAASGSLAGSSGGVTLSGPAGSVTLDRGVIVAARHLHLSPGDAAKWGLRDGDRLDVRCGTGARSTTFHDVLVRSSPAYATELHLDTDEAFAAGVRSGDRASILVIHGSSRARRPLITERDVIALARAGGTLPADALLTPSARDRARALGLAVGR